MKKLLRNSLIASGLLSITAFNAAAQQADSTSTPETSSAKVFGKMAQYRKWSVGINAGALAPITVFGGSNDYQNWDVNFGYGASLRRQFGHSFGIQANVLLGDVSGSNQDAPGGTANGFRSFDTRIGYAGSINGVVNVGTIDFLRRENSLNFTVSAGYGLMGYAPKYINAANITIDNKGSFGADRDQDFIREQFIPVGVGMKFKVSDRVNIDLGYTMHFIDGDNFDGQYGKGTTKDKFSYGFAGLEFSLGAQSKPNIDWVNPVAMMYDELKDPTLRQEVEALKGRTSKVEGNVVDLKKDSDADGVADQFDKCANTPANVKVDGSGCPLDSDGDGVADTDDKCPVEKGTAANNGCPEETGLTGRTLTAEEETVVKEAFSNLEFATGKSVISSSSYLSLNKLAELLVSKSDYKLEINGHTDNVGSESSNQTLSQNRANAVKKYLTGKNVNAANISANGFGETMPVASNDTAEGRQQNRRVEFVIK